MRKIIKPENIRRDKTVVKIPDVEFEVEPLPDDPEEEQENGQETEEKPETTVLTAELREQIEAEVREALAGEVSRKKIKTRSECEKLIRDAEKEAEGIIAQAEAQRQQILSQAQEDAAQLRAEACEKGAKQGFEEKTELLDNLAIYISHSIEEIKKERNQFFERYGKELKHLAVEISEKVIAQKIEDDDMIMYGVIKDAVRYVRDAKWVKVEVAEELSGYIDTLEKELAASGQNAEFILSAGIPKETCILNTSNGLVVATLSEQIKNIREFIENLDKGDSDEN